MLNLSVIRQLLPEEKYATLESALAFLQDVAQPDITNNDVSETMDAKHFNTVQRDIVSALNVLFTEIDAVEVILKQAANRTDSGLAEMVSKLDVLYQKTNEAKASLDNREAPLLNIEISKQTLNNDKELYGTYDIAEVNDFGLTTQRAGRILQSSYSGIPAATVNVNTYSIDTYTEAGVAVPTEIPCRLGIPANSEPYPKPMSVILNENNSTFWSETILSESVLQIEPNVGHWLYGTDYISGAAVQLVFDFETATRISQLEIVPFAPMPLTFLEVKAGADIVWKNSTGRIVENSGKYILFVEKDDDTPVISKKFTLTIAQPHCRQIEYGISQQNEQDLKYWQETAVATYPDDISVYNTDQFNSVVQSSMYNNDSIYTVSDTVNNWNTWAENFPQMLASKGIVLPAEQYRTVRGIGAKFGQISELLSTLATPTSNITKKVLRYEYIYGFRQVNFVYEEYNKAGRFISDQLELDGELRQVKAVLTTNPEDSTITQIHDGEIEITASFVGFSNVLSVGNDLALSSMKGMKCYLSDRKSTIFEIVDVDSVDDTLTLDRSQKSAFPDELISLQNKTWYLYTEDTKKNAEKNITLKLSLKDSELSNPIAIDDSSWTFIETQTEKPLVVQNPYRIATLSNGDMFVVYDENNTKKIAYCTSTGISYTIDNPNGSYTIFDILVTDQDLLFLFCYDSDSHISIHELLSITGSNDSIAATWDDVSPTNTTQKWYSDIKAGVSYYTNSDNSTLNIVLPYLATETTYGISHFSRSISDIKGTTFSRTNIPFDSSSITFPFKITHVEGIVQDTIEYFYITKTDTSSNIDGIYRNGVYRATTTGTEPRPIFYCANANTFQAFDFVKATVITTNTITDYSIFGVTDTGKVIEARIAPLDSYMLLGKYPAKVSTWDATSTSVSGMSSVSNVEDNLLYVADKENHCIKVFIIEEENVLTYKGWIGYGETIEDEEGKGEIGFHSYTIEIVPKQNNIAGGFKNPEYLTVDEDGNLLISDTGNNRIQKLDQNGIPIYWLGEDEVGNRLIHNNTYQQYKIATIDSAKNLVSGIDTGVGYTSTANAIPPTLGWNLSNMTAGKWYMIENGSYSGSGAVTDNTLLKFNLGGRVRLLDANNIYAESVCWETDMASLYKNIFVVYKLPRYIKAGSIKTLVLPIRILARSVVGDCSIRLGTNWDGYSLSFGTERARTFSKVSYTQGTSVIELSIDMTYSQTDTLKDEDSFNYIGISLIGLQQGWNSSDYPNVSRVYGEGLDIPIVDNYEYSVGCIIGNITTVEPTENLIDNLPVSSSNTYGFSSPRGVAISRIATMRYTPSNTSDNYLEVLTVADYNNNRIQNIPIRTLIQSKAASIDQLNFYPFDGYNEYTLNSEIDITEPTAISATKFIKDEISSNSFVYATSPSSHIAIKYPLLYSTTQATKFIKANSTSGLLITAGTDYVGLSGNSISVEIVQGNGSLGVAFANNKLTITLAVSSAQNTISNVYNLIASDISDTNIFADVIGTVGSYISPMSETNLSVKSETLGYSTTEPHNTVAYGLPNFSVALDYEQSEIDGGFKEPSGLAINNNNNTLHIIDQTGRVQVYDINNGILDVLHPEYTFGQPGSGDNQVQLPHSMHIAKDGKLFITDKGNNRLKVYSTTGSFVWNTTQVSEGDQLDIVGVECLVDRFNSNPIFYLCQSDGYVYSYSLYNEEWRRTNCDYIIGGIKAICTENEFSGDKSLYAISTLGTIYKALPNGQWQWLRSAVEKSIISPNSITEKFTKTDPTGKITLSEWPYVDFEGINSYYNNNNSSQHYNPNNIMIPAQCPFEVEILLKDGTKAIPDTTGVPFHATGRKIFQTIPSSVNSMNQNATLSAVSPYIMSPVTIVDEETLGNYTDQLADSNINFKRGQTSLTFSRVVGRRIFKSRYKDWLPDPSFKIGILVKDINGDEKLYYKGSSTHKVKNLPIPNIIPKEGLIVFREDLPKYFELQEPGDASVRLVEAFDDELKIVVFDFFASDYVIVQRNNDGTISRDSNGEHVYIPLQTRSVPYTTNCTDYLRGLSPDVSRTPYNASVPVNDPLYNPVLMYTHNGRDIMFNSPLTENDVQSITVKYNSLELRPRLIVDMNRKNYPVTKTPIIESCNLLIGRINP